MDVFPGAASLPAVADYQGSQPVAIDVLRATTTVIAALAAGAAAVVPTLSPETARAGAGTIPGALLGGERHNVRIPGFHFGNSPLEYTAERVAGRQIFFTTSNGTRAIHALAPLGPVLIAALVNVGAVARRLRLTGAPVLILCAGAADQLCLEDTVCAGALVAALEAEVELSDLAWLARALYLQHRHDLTGLLRQGRHGQRLVEQGFAADVELCGQIDRFDLAPVYQRGLISNSPDLTPG